MKHSPDAHILPPGLCTLFWASGQTGPVTVTSLLHTPAGKLVQSLARASLSCMLSQAERREVRERSLSLSRLSLWAVPPGPVAVPPRPRRTTGERGAGRGEVCKSSDLLLLGVYKLSISWRVYIAYVHEYYVM